MFGPSRTDLSDPIVVVRTSDPEPGGPSSDGYAGIVATRAGALDLEYVEQWVKALGLEAEWARARAGDTT